MKHSLPFVPQFYVTAAQECPYLPARAERKLFTALHGEASEALNNCLSKQGFRRSQNVLYRPACAECAACLSARIDVEAFSLSRNQKRTVKRNSSLSRTTSSPWATEYQYALFRTYLDHRHSEGGMSDMDLFEFAAMIEETPVKTRLVEYHDLSAAEDDPYEKLRAASLTDVLDDGLSMVYSFYDPSMRQNSLGTYLILDHIALARELGLQFVYLGYWVPGSEKMGYKANFSGLQIYHGGEWKILDTCENYAAFQHPLEIEPIPEQVAQIRLPDIV